MSARSPAPLGIALVALALLAAGCVGGDAPDPADPAGADETGATNGSASTPDPPTVVAASNPEVPVLGLAAYDGVPRERVAPHVPGDAEPTPCFRPNETEALEVYLVVTEERHPDLLPDQEAAVRSVSLVACAERPDGLRWDHANEPPWVLLASWGEGEAVEAYLSQRGFSANDADIEIETTPDGYRFQAATPDGTSLARGHFSTPGVGAPRFLSCEPTSFRGRVVQEGPRGLVSLDWNKTEAACPADAAITWPADGPVAEILGPARAPSYAVDGQVEDARYWYRLLVER